MNHDTPTLAELRAEAYRLATEARHDKEAWIYAKAAVYRRLDTLRPASSLDKADLAKLQDMERGLREHAWEACDKDYRSRLADGRRALLVLSPITGATELWSLDDRKPCPLCGKPLEALTDEFCGADCSIRYYQSAKLRRATVDAYVKRVGGNE